MNGNDIAAIVLACLFAVIILGGTLAHMGWLDWLWDGTGYDDEIR